MEYFRRRFGELLMKWYSVKKYKPPIYCDVICRVLDCEYGETIIMGSYSRKSNRWDFNEEPLNEIYRYTVTHFCIPDPIEIDE
jgi:hypothetical protein